MAYQRKAGDNITFWKINHLPSSDKFNFLNYDWKSCIVNRIIIVRGKSECEKLTAMRRGDYFYLCHGNVQERAQGGIKLIGRIIDDKPTPYPVKRPGEYYQRHYEMLFPKNGEPLMGKFYTGEEKAYAPGFFGGDLNESIYEISQEQADDFETDILWSFFEAELGDFEGLWGLTANSSSKSLQVQPSVVTTLKPVKKFSRNQIFYGTPGTGKTYLTVAYAIAICGNEEIANALDGDMRFVSENYDAIKKEFDKLSSLGRIKFVTFHQSYGYEDFIEGIKPTVDERGNVSYNVESGVFKKFCDEARYESGNMVFIIDEINRGNISKIFGELITLIEDDKRGEISVTLPYSQETFTVPKNVYIIGTMNTADRSIALMDTALRRRFNFVEMMSRPDLLSENVDGVNLRTMLETLNTRIETLLDREHTIGHAYFIKCKKIADIAEVFRNKVIPLLQEYFFDDYEQIQLVLGEKFIRKEKLPALGDVDEKYRYTIDNAAFDDAASYQL